MLMSSRRNYREARLPKPDHSEDSPQYIYIPLSSSSPSPSSSSSASSAKNNSRNSWKNGNDSLLGFSFSLAHSLSPALPCFLSSGNINQSINKLIFF
ncbi:hypothetical protein Peur_060386 [Populus x canadensis]